MPETLTALIKQKQYLETQLEDVLTYSEELEEVWKNNAIDIAKKVDAYGFVIDDIKRKSDYLAEKKRKLTDIKNRLDNEIEKIKGRLYEHANNAKLEGNEYKFHPFISKTNTVDINKVEQNLMSYTIGKLTFEEYSALDEIVNLAFVNASEENSYEDAMILSVLVQKLKDAKGSCNVTDLPAGHSALITELKPSVRIT